MYLLSKRISGESVHLGCFPQQKCYRLVRVASRLPVSYLLRLILAIRFLSTLVMSSNTCLSFACGSGFCQVSALLLSIFRAPNVLRLYCHIGFCFGQLALIYNTQFKIKMPISIKPIG